MASTRGACYVAFGASYLEMAFRSFASLRRFEPDLPVVILVDRETVSTTAPQDANLRIVRLEVDRDQNRAVKTRLPDFVSFDHGLYLDADTLVLRPIRPLFKHLEAFDLCAAFCGYCINGAAAHLTPDDKAATLEVCPPDSLHYQCGVFCWRRTPEALETFRLWHQEWQRFKKHDQGAFARAVWRGRARLGVLFRDEWNVLVPTHHSHKRLIHYADRKPRGLGNVFPEHDPAAQRRHEPRIPGSEVISRGEQPRETVVAQPVLRHRRPQGDAEARRPDHSTPPDHPAPPDNTGICYVAFGDAEFEQATRSVESLLSTGPGLSVLVLTEAARPCPASWKNSNVQLKSVNSEDPAGRSIQTSLPLHVPFDRCLVLPPDSRILQSVWPVLRHLESFDLCFAFDPRGVIREARHLSPKERIRTFALCTDSFLFHEPGLICWRRTESVLEFYRIWHDEWRDSHEHLEGALARAIWESDVRIGVLWPGIWNHTRISDDLRILRGTDRMPSYPGTATLMPLVDQVAAMLRRERRRVRR